MPFILFTLPWMFAIPKSVTYSVAWAWAAYPVAWLMVGINAFILYCAVALAGFVLNRLAVSLPLRNWKS